MLVANIKIWKSHIISEKARITITPALTLIFQASLEQGQISNEWKTANVAPIFKKGDKSKPSNYRLVSLTSICSKVIKHILHSHIMKFFEQHHILLDSQHQNGI